MPRTQAQLPLLIFTEADLALEHDFALDFFVPSPPQKQPPSQHEDIVAALEAIASRRCALALTPAPPPPPPTPHLQPTAHLSPTSPSPLTAAAPPAAPPQPLLQAPTTPLLAHLAPQPSLPIPLTPPSRKKPRSRRRSPLPPSPSRFCHVCARTQKSEKIFCANLHTDRKCRKAVCRPCFAELQWDFESAKASGTWICPHCRGICDRVPRARCHIYTKTNMKRKASRLLGALVAGEPC